MRVHTAHDQDFQWCKAGCITCMRVLLPSYGNRIYHIFILIFDKSQGALKTGINSVLWAMRRIWEISVGCFEFLGDLEIIMSSCL